MEPLIIEMKKVMENKTSLTPPLFIYLLKCLVYIFFHFIYVKLLFEFRNVHNRKIQKYIYTGICLYFCMYPLLFMIK